MDNEELLLSNWENFWLKQKKNKLANLVRKTNNQVMFLSAPLIDERGAIVWSNFEGYSKLNSFTLSQFIQEFNEEIGLERKKVLVVQNLDKPNIIYDVFSSYLDEFNSTIYVTKRKQRTCDVVVKEVIKRVSVDLAFYFYEDNTETYLLIYNNKGELLDKEKLTQIIEKARIQNVDLPNKNYNKAINIDQNLVIEDYAEKLIKDFAGSFLYDEPLVNVFVHNNKTQYDTIFKLFAQKMKWNIKFSKLSNRIFFTRFLNWIRFKLFRNTDLILDFKAVGELPEIKMFHDAKYKTIQSNNLCGSFLDHYLESEKRLGNSENLNIILDNYSNKFVEKIISKYNQNNQQNEDEYFFKKQEHNISLSSKYPNDNIPFLFKYIQYVNYLKNQNINFFLKWKSLFKIYGNYFEAFRTFDFVDVDSDSFRQSLENNLDASQFEVEDITKITNGFKIKFENDMFVVVTFDALKKHYKIFININKNQRKFKKITKKLFNTIIRSITETQ
ncbi:Uncharacterised protein [Mycoplasmopsis californica]|uniref:Uncharacterized protein n=1 Tax=Mycoplasmopsis equigenitalium TaxID=114883 RepID=A0ABY5J4N0_9BACT|nr:hypothetical protein [Mycoplasmopsis equigenitalium]UUD36910.1 hypothetical protein NPA09_03360 [Mycoplasmopsis equigenitalium]VEU69795.1 Uncharacterised protein [Mycoplasmopsis californica]